VTDKEPVKELHPAFEKVMEHARGRHSMGNLPRLEDEVNFLMGAGAMWTALGNPMADVPASWIFGLLGGQSACGIEYPPEDKGRKRHG